MALVKRGALYASYLTVLSTAKRMSSREFWEAKLIFAPLIGPRLHAAISRRWGAIDESRLNFYRQFLKPGDLVYDVGANIGNRTKVFLRLGAKVVAFEPQKRCARLLRSTFGPDKKFDLVEQALGARSSTGIIYLSTASPISSMSRDWIQTTSSSGRFSRYSWKKQQEVQIDTLDAHIARTGAPAFIKIDVEGFEHEVLAGLTRQISTISFEYTPEFMDSSLLCMEMLGALGNIEYQFSFGESMNFALDYWVGAETLKLFLATKAGNDFGDIYARCV